MIRRLVVTSALMALIAAGVLAQAPGDKPKLPGEDWVQLFNGKDLTGWIPVGNEKWTVENGNIEGRTLTDGCSFWLTSTTVRPFASFLISKGGKVTGRGGSGRGGNSLGQAGAGWSPAPAVPGAGCAPATAAARVRAAAVSRRALTVGLPAPATRSSA